jgi:hypothetical protein
MRIRVFITSTIVTAAAIMFAAPANAQTATASATLCKDGTTSTATGKDICVGHGGLKEKATSTVSHDVTCADGTMHESKAACKDHGGVKATEHVTTTTTTKKTSSRANEDAVDALALCKNGKYWHSTSRRGACSGNGGVDKFLKP